MKKNFEPLLKLLPGYYGYIDTKEKKVIEVYRNSKLFAQNIDYALFCDNFEKAEHIDPKSYDRKLMLSWLVKYTKDRSIGMSFETLDKQPKDYIIKFIYNKDDNYTYFYASPTSTFNTSFQLSDSLTHLYLRVGIETLIKNEIAKKNPRPFNLIIVDLDNFKTMNDLYGHLFGDHMLQVISEILKKFSPDCSVGRLGGDEFLILDFSATSYEDLWNRLHVLFNTIRNTNFTENISMTQFNLSNTKFFNFHPSITAGVVRYPFDGEDYETLFMKADKALYRGKRKGKNCYIIYNDDKHKNINVDREITFDSPNRRDTLIYETLLLHGIEELEANTSFHESIYNYIKTFGEYLAIDRICVYKHIKAFEDELITAYVNPNIPEASLTNVARVIHESEESKNMDLVREYKRTHIDPLKDLKPGVYEYLIKENIKSFLQLPIYHEGNLYGFIRFDSCQDIRSWSEEEENLYKLLTKVLSVYVHTYTQITINNGLLGRDNLTGLFDYKATLYKLEKLLAETSGEYVILYTNLYKFRFFNDNFGYQTGDNILRLLSRSLSTVDSDLVGRLNGDHFVVMFKFKSLSDIKDRINIISEHFNQSLRGMAGADEINVLFGAYITDGSETNGRACIDKARIALFSIESNSTSNFRIFDNEINLNYITQKNILQTFNQDIAEGKFEVFLQPKIDAKTNKLIGAEALSRWKYNDTYANPESYIEILENYNLIDVLDLYVFESVLKFMTELKKNNKELFPISVNLSKKQKEVVKYVGKLENIRQKYDISPDLLEIEITESSFLNNYNDTMKAIKLLKDYGYIVDMDDFGIGYSNLSLLSKGVFDVIKFDRALVQNVEQETSSKILFHSIELAKSLGMKIVCEGVETSKQKELILQNGGQIVQGFYYSRPLCIKEFCEKYIK